MTRKYFFKKTISYLVGAKILSSEKMQAIKILEKQESIDNLFFADFHVHATLKAFSSDVIKSPWLKITHDCSDNIAKWLIKFVKELPKNSQSNYEALIKGNVRLACISLLPIEKKMILPKFIEDRKKSDTCACISGINKQYNYEKLYTEEIDYFEDLTKHIDYLLSYENLIHHIEGKDFTYTIPKNGEELKGFLLNKNKLVIVVTIEGGHSLGNSIEIKDTSESEEFRQKVMKNIKKLKGIIPLHDNIPKSILELPILSIGLNHFFWNGFSGHAKTLDDKQSLLMSQKKHLDESITILGKEVVVNLLDKKKGRRILIDIKHMSLSTRKWYYNFIIERKKMGDDIPIICTHTGIAGLSWYDEEYLKNDNSNKIKSSFLNTWTINLSNQDIIEIYNSKGIIGIQLDKNKICGGGFFKLTSNSNLSNKENYIKIIVANILSIVKAVNKQNVWDMICIGSDYDGLITPFEIYPTSAEFGLLYEDLLNFFCYPTSIFNLFSLDEVKQLMFGFNADYIVKKIISNNLTTFLVNNLGS